MANDYLSPGIAQDADGADHFSWDDAFQRYSYVALLGFTAVLIYSFLNMFASTSAFWERAQYSHGWIMPLVALYLMWVRRPNPAAQEPPEGQSEQTFFGLLPVNLFGRIVASVGAPMLCIGFFSEIPVLMWSGLLILCLGGLAYVMVGQPFSQVTDADRWIGLAIVLVSYAVRVLFAAPYEVEPVNRMMFMTSLFGVFLMVGGWRLIAWTGPGIGFLVFMFPLPSRIEQPLLAFLQRLASIAGEIVLTILGLPVIRTGSRLDVDGVPLEVAEACSGMRMLTIFGGLALAVAILIDRPWWDRFIILLSAVPIALLVNITRIVVTAVLARTFKGNEMLDTAIHDMPGFAMMFMAMGLLYLELKVLGMLSVPEESVDLQAAGGGSYAVR